MDNVFWSSGIRRQQRDVRTRQDWQDIRSLDPEMQFGPYSWHWSAFKFKLAK